MCLAHCKNLTNTSRLLNLILRRQVQLSGSGYQIDR